MDQAELIKVIEKAAREGARKLDLTGRGINQLPEQVGSLTSLQELYLSANQLSTLPERIVQLANLQKLYLYGNRLSTLPEQIAQLANLQRLSASANQLSTVPDQIGRLAHLQELHLSSNQLSTVPEQIGQLANLRELRLSSNHLSTLPEQIGRLAKLQKLYVHDNHLSTLPEQIGQLLNLRTLRLHSNQLSTLPEQIGQLAKLQTLSIGGNLLERLPRSIGSLKKLTRLFVGDEEHVRGNPLIELPVEIRNLTQLRELDVSTCPGLNLPPEIVAKRDSPKEILDYYFRSRTQPAPPLNEAKVLVVGEAGVGKTSLIKRLLNKGKFDPNEDQTHGIVTHRWDLPLDDRTVRLNVWDFGGQEIMHATHQFFLTKRSLYLLVLDSRQNERQSRIEYWLKLIHSFGEDSPVIVVCNKCDQQQMELDWSGLREKYGHIKAIVRRVSCYHDKATGDDRSEGLDEVHTAIAEQVGQLEHVDTPFLATWSQVKADLEEIDESFIEYKEFIRRCEVRGIKEEGEQKTLIGFLHDLGIVLHFSDHPLLHDTNVLNPLWVTNAVYRILNCNELFQSRGVLLFSELGNLLKSVETEKFKYPENRRLFVIEMMRRFELCFDFEGRANEQFLIPDLLPLAAPDTGDWTGSLGFQYRYEILPQSVMSRFIVRMNELVSERTYWRKGVVLASEGNRALVKADFEDARIDIRVDGPVPSRRRLLKSIRDQFAAIHATIPRIGGKEYVPIGDGPTPAVSYKRLYGLERQGEPREYIEEIDEFRSVSDLLDGVDQRGFDVFLSHNSEDKVDVRRLNTQLKKRGVITWLDEEQLAPGRTWMDALEEIVKSCRCAVVCVGPNGIGPWHKAEMQALLNRFAGEEKHDPGSPLSVIPVLLPNAPADVELPLFLERFTWVDLRGGLRKAGIDRLIWGITGEKR